MNKGYQIIRGCIPSEILDNISLDLEHIAKAGHQKYIDNKAMYDNLKLVNKIEIRLAKHQPKREQVKRLSRDDKFAIGLFSAFALLIAFLVYAIMS